MKTNTLTAVFVLLLLNLTLVAGAEVVTREIPAGPGGLLEIDLETGGSLEITGGRNDAVVVRANIPDAHKHQGNLTIEPTSRGARIASELNGDDNNGIHKLKLTIEVPQQFDLDIETSGTVRLTDLHGQIKGTTLGGQLILTRLGGELDLTTMGGGVELVDSNVDGKVTTMGGKVLFRDVHGTVKGTSMGGEVIYENVTRPDGTSTGVGGEVNISTMGGRLHVEDAPEGARLSTMGGDIEVDSAAVFVDAETMGGDIRLESIDGWVKAVTMSGDIEVNVVGGGGDVELTSMNGNVHLTVPAGLSMEIDVEVAVTRDRFKPGKFKINSDFPLEVQETKEWDYRDGKASKYVLGKTSGGGANKVVIRTTNGNVTLTSG